MGHDAKPAPRESGAARAEELARWLSEAEVDAVACPWLPCVSLFTDEWYENFDYDLIGPKVRLKIARVLEERGLRQRRGTLFEGPQGRVELPRTTRTLASDPAYELERVVDRGTSMALATPTQVVLMTWRRDGPDLAPERLDQLLALVRQHPANLDKVGDWLRRTPCRAPFAASYPALAAAQQEGIEQRRRRRR
jgi:hypothetical protein